MVIMRAICKLMMSLFLFLVHFKCYVWLAEHIWRTRVYKVHADTHFWSRRTKPCKFFPSSDRIHWWDIYLYIYSIIHNFCHNLFSVSRSVYDRGSYFIPLAFVAFIIGCSMGVCAYCTAGVRHGYIP